MNDAFLRLVVSSQTNPYWNVAVENYLLSLPEERVVTLYLWKNHRTVVVGQNQNPFAECDVNLLQRDGGFVMRRSTGGGAVYHDDGNINFSFVAPYTLYDQSRQFAVLQRAVESFGLTTQLSGRNDVLCDGRKFSGNAFSKAKYQRLHHGTILIKSNMSDLQRYLKPNPDKLRKHGVQSVQSRVVNLSELAPIDSVNIVPRLIAAFEQVYGAKAERIDFESLLLLPEVVGLYRHFSSDEWLFARWRDFHTQRSGVFPWGTVQLSFDVDEQRAVIHNVNVASDALDVSAVDDACRLLQNATLSSLSSLASQSDNVILSDIVSLLIA